MPKSPNDVKKLVEDAKIEIIDLRFVDLPGVWQHFSLPARELSDDMFTDGLGFDGSSIRGYQQIQESDMLLIPDPETAFVDPVLQVPTLSMICNVLDPVTRERVHPRPAAHRPEGRGLPEEHRHRRHQLLGARGRVLHLRRRPLRPERPRAATTSSTRSRASGTPAARRARTWATSCGTRRATSPARRPTSSRTCAPR